MFTPFPGTLIEYPSKRSPEGSTGFGIACLENFVGWFIVLLEREDDHPVRQTLLVRDGGWLAALLLDLQPEKIVDIRWMHGAVWQQTWHQIEVREIYLEQQHEGRDEDRLVIRTTRDRLLDAEGSTLNVSVDMFCSSRHVRSLFKQRNQRPSSDA